MSWATPQHVVDRWVGTGAPTDIDLVQALINDAEAVILAEFPKIQDRIDAKTLPLNTVIMVVCRMASRMLRNPEGLTYWQQTTGPFGQARNYGSNGADIWMTTDERELLAPKRRGKAFQIDTAPYATNGGNWIWLSGDGINEGFQTTGSGEND
jgi:hypothetical protein